MANLGVNQITQNMSHYKNGLERGILKIHKYTLKRKVGGKNS